MQFDSNATLKFGTFFSAHPVYSLGPETKLGIPTLVSIAVTRFLPLDGRLETGV